jgi:hypothetical protein
MSEEKFEEFLKQHASAYNTPGETPRDEMWQVIAKARAKPKAQPKSWLRAAPWIGMAATLLLGIGLGRFMMQTDPIASTPTPIAQAPLPAVIVDPTPADPAATDAPVPTQVTARRTPAPAARRETLDPAPAVNVASREHMARAEALITVIAATPADVVMDSLTGRWARDMLSNTRLLLDSPAGDDPARRQLLEDLETVLVLLVQRSGAAVDERALLDRSLQRTQLLTRLRSGAAGI